MKKTLITTFFVALAIGCATPTPQTQPPLANSRDYNASFDQVWQSLITWLSADHTFKTVDKSSGLLVIDMESFGRGFQGWTEAQKGAYQPQSIFFTWMGGARRSTTILVEKLDETATHVRVNCHVEVYEDNVSHQWYGWQSRGIWENQLLENLGILLANPHATLPSSKPAPEPAPEHKPITGRI